MLRFRTFVVAATIAALSLTASAEAAPPKVIGAVGPGFTITLKRFNKPVRSLKAGRYSITVFDRSGIHDFHLRGPGLNRIITGVGFVGTKTIVVRLSKGTYRFVCDPHLTTMHGSFKVL